MAEQDTGRTEEQDIDGLVAGETEPTDAGGEEPTATPEPTEEPVKEPAEDAEPPNGQATATQAKPQEQPQHNFDKGLQKLQQELAALKRQLATQPTPPTPAQQQQAQAIKDALDELVEKPDDQVDPYVASKTLAKEVKGLKERLAKYEQEDRASTGRIASTVDELREHHARAQFSQLFPGVDYEACKKEALAEAAPLMESPEYTPLVGRMIWQQVVDRHVAAVKAKAPPPPSKTPDKPTAGTQITKSNAAARLVPKKEVSDDDLIDDLLKVT